MLSLSKSLHLIRFGSRLIAAPTLLTLALTGLAHAQTEETLEPDATTASSLMMQYSTLTASTNTIVASRVPVLTTAGKVLYWDVSLLFNADSTGKLTLAAGYPKAVLSQTLVVSQFKTGKYVGPSSVLNGAAIITVSGPGVASGGATEWSLAAASGASYETYPTSATWYLGTLASTPLAARLKKAGITSTAWSYGLGGGTYGGGKWGPNTLLGFSQTGNTITIVSFTTNGLDSSQPADQITYTLAP